MARGAVRHPVPHRHLQRARRRYSPAALCWFGFVLTTIVVNNAYSGRQVMLTAIDGAHWLGVLVIIGAILGDRA